MSTTTSQVGSAMMWSVLAKGARFILGLASSVVVVRSLGDHDYGVLSVIRSILTLVMILAGAGLGQAVLKFLPQLRVEKGVAGARSLVRIVFGAQILVWVVIVIVGYLGRPLIESIFKFDDFGVLVVAGLALMFFEMIFTIMSQIMNARYDTKLLSFASVASHVVYIGLLVVTLPAGWGVLGVIVSASAGYLVACLTIAGRVTSGYGHAERESSGPRIAGSRLARFAIPLTLVGILHFVVWRQSETLLLGYFRTASETAYFDLAYRIPQTILEFVPGTVWPLVMAGISEVYSRNTENIRLAIDRYYRMLFLMCAPISFAGMVLSGKMIPIVWGDAMLPAAVPTQLFFGIFLISFLGSPLSMTLYVIEKTHVNLVIYFCLAVVNVGMDLILIPRYGVTGAIIPVAAVIFASPIVYRLVLGRYVKGIKIPLRFIGKCFLGSSPVLLLVPLLGFVTGPLELAVAAVAAIGLIVAGFKIARVLGKEELEMLGAVPVPMADRVLKFMSS